MAHRPWRTVHRLRGLYQVSMIITHLTGVSSPLARSGRRRGVGHHKAPAPCTRRGGEGARDRGLRWGEAARRRAQIGHTGAALAPWTYALGSHIALRAAPTRRTASPHEMGDYHRDLI